MQTDQISGRGNSDARRYGLAILAAIVALFLREALWRE
jgi:hypothetical protein